MFIYFTSAKGISYLLNINKIFFVLNDEKKNHAVIRTTEGESLELDESFTKFTSRLAKITNVSFC